jgi:hypothetical protein
MGRQCKDMNIEPDVAADWTQAKICPECCTTDDIPLYEPSADVLTPLVECARCGFRFPILPGEFSQLTLDSMHRHDCCLDDEGDWQALGLAIVNAIREHAITGADLAERLGVLWPGNTPDGRATGEK